MSSHKYSAPITLHERTLELLKKDLRPLPAIGHQAGVPFYWLEKFVRGKIKDPSVNRIQKLYEHLTGTTLNVG